MGGAYPATLHSRMPPEKPSRSCTWRPGARGAFGPPPSFRGWGEPGEAPRGGPPPGRGGEPQRARGGAGPAAPVRSAHGRSLSRHPPLQDAPREALAELHLEAERPRLDRLEEDAVEPVERHAVFRRLGHLLPLVGLLVEEPPGRRHAAEALAGVV